MNHEIIIRVETSFDTKKVCGLLKILEVSMHEVFYSTQYHRLKRTRM
jgi:hypothetical protein